jgi:hypothetical protein
MDIQMVESPSQQQESDQDTTRHREVRDHLMAQLRGENKTE